MSMILRETTSATFKFQWKVDNDRSDRSRRIRCLIIAVACTYFRSFFPRTYVCAEFCVVAVISISRGVPCFFSPSLFALCLFLINVRRTCERGRRNETRCNLKIAILKGIRDSRWKFLWKLNFLFVSGSTNRKRRIWFASFRIPIHVFASHVQIFMEIRIKIIKS